MLNNRIIANGKVTSYIDSGVNKTLLKDFSNAGVMMEMVIQQANNKYHEGCVIVNYNGFKVLIPRNKLSDLASKSTDISDLKDFCRDNFGQLITPGGYTKLQEVVEKYDDGTFQIDTIKHEDVPTYVLEQMELSNIQREERHNQELLDILSMLKPAQTVEPNEENNYQREMPAITCEDVDVLIFQNTDKDGKKLKALDKDFASVIASFPKRTLSIYKRVESIKVAFVRKMLLKLFDKDLIVASYAQKKIANQLTCSEEKLKEITTRLNDAYKDAKLANEAFKLYPEDISKLGDLGDKPAMVLQFGGFHLHLEPVNVISLEGGNLLESLEQKDFILKVQKDKDSIRLELEPGLKEYQNWAALGKTDPKNRQLIKFPQGVDSLVDPKDGEVFYLYPADAVKYLDKILPST